MRVYSILIIQSNSQTVSSSETHVQLHDASRAVQTKKGCGLPTMKICKFLLCFFFVIDNDCPLWQCEKTPIIFGICWLQVIVRSIYEFWKEKHPLYSISASRDCFSVRSWAKWKYSGMVITRLMAKFKTLMYQSQNITNGIIYFCADTRRHTGTLWNFQARFFLNCYWRNENLNRQNKIIRC